MVKAKSEDTGVIKQGSIAQFMRKRTQLVGFDYGIYKHVQYVAEFIDNSLDAIERFQWEEQKKRARGDDNYSFSLDKEISLENLTLGVDDAYSQMPGVELKGGLKKKEFAQAFEFTAGEPEPSPDDEAEEDEESEEEGVDLEIPTGVEELPAEELPELEEEQGEIVAEDEIEEVEEEVLEKEVKEIVEGLEEFIGPIVNLVDDEPFVVIKINEADVKGVLAAAMGNKDAKLFTFEVFDNGTGMIGDDLQKFGKYLASSKSQKLKQTRGSQGFGSPSAFSDAQNTTGKPIIVVSKHSDELYANATQFFTTSKNTKKYVFPPTEISVPFSHGTYIKLSYLNVRYRKGFTDRYIRQTAILNPHVTIIFIEPQTTKKKREAGLTQKITIYPRIVAHFPEEPTYAMPHPESVNIGDFQDQIRNSENLTVSAFLTDSFVRLSSTIAKKILAQSERSLALHYNMIPIKDSFLTKTQKTSDKIFHITEEMRIFGRSTKKRKTWVVRFMDPKNNAQFADGYFDLVGKLDKIETENEKIQKKIQKLEKNIDKETVKKNQRVLEKQVKNHEKDIKANLKEIMKFENELAKFITPFIDKFTEMEEKPERTKIIELVEDILVSRRRPRDCTMEQINHLFISFKDQKYLAPPTDTAIPVGSEVLENVLIKEYGLDIPQRVEYFRKKNDTIEPEEEESSIGAMLAKFARSILEKGQTPDRMILDKADDIQPKDYEEGLDFLEESRAISDDFVAGETRDPTSGKGLAFAVEAAVAMSPKIPSSKKAQDVLARYVNRTPKLRDNSDCAIWQSVSNVNWKNYKLDVFDNGIPKGSIRIFLNVSGPFVHLMFKSQSKNALAEDENLTKEIKLCLESIGRRVRAYLNKKVNREKRKKRSSVLVKHVPQFVESLYNMANSHGRYAGQLKKELLKQRLIEAIGQKAASSPASELEEEEGEEAPQVSLAEAVKAKAAEAAPAITPKEEAVPKAKKPKKVPEPEPEAAEEAEEEEVEVKEKVKPKTPKGKPKKPTPTPKVTIGAQKIEKKKPKVEEKAPAKEKAKPKPSPAEKPKPKKKGTVIIDKTSILENLGEWSTIRDLINKMHVVSMMDARFLQIKLRQLEKEKAVQVEIRKGKKYWKRP